MAFVFQNVDAQAVAALRDQVLEICIDSAFLFTGLAACSIAAVRRTHGVRIFFWLGIWSGSYGLLHILGVPSVVMALPQRLWFTTPYIQIAIVYLMLVFAASAWLTLLRGIVHRIVVLLTIAAGGTAAPGIAWFIATGVGDQFIGFNNVLAACVLTILVATVTSRRLSQKYLVLPERGFLVFGTMAFAIEALAANVAHLLGSHMPLLLDHLGFAVLILAFGYSALKLTLKNEHRLFAIESELEIARQIQSTILPIATPEIRGLRISATYRPMTAVAGDFYEFLPVDDLHAGFLVADVCGHGVPAALIASMLKVAVQSVTDNASDPATFLASLNRVLAGSLHSQLVSAAYLWIDMQKCTALYSAAGHPPLLRWNRGLESFESNGLLFGVVDDAQYPVKELRLKAGDRLLLYTDGITEPENAAGQAFGDARLPEILASSLAADAEDLSSAILSEIQQWQPSSAPQDDRTLIVIDVVKAAANPATPDIMSATHATASRK
jgi:sigma-B regulation protein RsbU (phosphoserine phosphatase)